MKAKESFPGRTYMFCAAMLVVWFGVGVLLVPVATTKRLLAPAFAGEGSAFPKAQNALAPTAPLTAEPDPAARGRVMANYGKLPLSFEPNQGQSDGRVKFLARGSGYTLYLTAKEAVLALQKIDSKGENQNAKISNAGLATDQSDPNTQTRDALPELKAGPSTEEESQRQEELAATGAAAASGDQAALRTALLSPDPMVATVAFQNLTELDPALAEEVIADAAKSDQLMTRLKALQLLDQVSQVDEDTVLSGLRDALHDPDPGVKVYAVQALAARGVPEAIDYLRQAFRDLDLNLKMMVIEAVAHNEEGLPLLQEATTDADESVRSAASLWLAQANAVE